MNVDMTLPFRREDDDAPYAEKFWCTLHAASAQSPPHALRVAACVLFDYMLQAHLHSHFAPGNFDLSTTAPSVICFRRSRLHCLASCFCCAKRFASFFFLFVLLVSTSLDTKALLGAACVSPTIVIKGSTASPVMKAL